MRPSSLRPFARRSSAALLVTLALVVTPLVSSVATPRPVAPETAAVPLSGVDPRAVRDLTTSPKVTAPLRVAAISAPIDVTGHAVVGVTWSEAAAPGRSDVGDVLVRTRSDETWSAWEELHVDDSHGPDPGTPEAARSRRGSAPLVVLGAADVQVRVATTSGRVPRDLRVERIDPGGAGADSGPRIPTAAAGAVRPSILSRAQWGADESIRRGTPSYGTVDVGFVHHTAGTNTYTSSQVPGVIRGIYAYHVKSLGWNDIGYNFLVDKWGRIWEGRAGGTDRPVVGAHTLGYNSHSFAMAALGSYGSTTVPVAVQNAYTSLFAWKLGQHYVDPTGVTSLTDADGSPTKIFRNISGHRDFGDSGKSTACPGDRLYALIDNFRSRARAAQGAMFYDPTTDRREWEARAPGGLTVRARANTQLSWRLDVRSAGHPSILTSRTGTATATSGVVARWDGLVGGLRVPAGSYELTLSATSSGTGPAGAATPFRFTVQVTSNTSIEDVLDRTDRKPPRSRR